MIPRDLSSAEKRIYKNGARDIYSLVSKVIDDELSIVAKDRKNITEMMEKSLREKGNDAFLIQLARKYEALSESVRSIERLKARIRLNAEAEMMEQKK